jgi:hypothetical protein
MQGCIVVSSVMVGVDGCSYCLLSVWWLVEFLTLTRRMFGSLWVTLILPLSPWRIWTSLDCLLRSRVCCYLDLLLGSLQSSILAGCRDFRSCGVVCWLMRCCLLLSLTIYQYLTYLLVVCWMPLTTFGVHVHSVPLLLPQSPRGP